MTKLNKKMPLFHAPQEISMFTIPTMINQCHNGKVIVHMKFLVLVIEIIAEIFLSTFPRMIGQRMRDIVESLLSFIYIQVV